VNDRVRGAKRLVVKVGSSLVTNRGEGLDLAAMEDWARQIARLRATGKEVVLVSSGAIAAGMQRLGWKKRPHAMHELQAAAAVGQMGLAEAYEGCFRKHSIHTAQVLLTHADLADRSRYLNARSTLRTLIALGVVAVINENDTVVTDEIRVGDNDTLAALVASLIEADVLVILTDTAPLAARKQWLADHVQVGGRLVLDAGAVRALAAGGKSLLPIGVKSVDGDFERGAVVACAAPDGREVARGLINYSAAESRRILGRPSGEIESVLGYVDGPELIHRDNLVLL